jgi:hypothetical protein
LRLEIALESDKKKMHFIFNYDQKIFLTGKRSARVDLKTEIVVSKKFSFESNRDNSEIPRLTDYSADSLRIPSLTKLACARNFPAL